MSVRRSFLNWGVFLICLGAVPLAVQAGVLSSDTAADLLRLWPLILIGIGLGLLLRLTPYGALGGIVVAGTFGLLIGVVLAGGFSRGGAVACAGGSATGPSTIRNGSVSDTGMSLNGEFTCADVEISRAPGGAWSVDFVGENETPRIDGTGASLDLRSDTHDGFGPFNGDSRERWRVVLPSEPTLGASFTFNATAARLLLGNGGLGSINATLNATDAFIDLSSGAGSATTAGSLSATLNASSMDLLLPAASMSGNITLNAASLNVCTAPGTAVRIDFEETLSSNNFAAAGLVQNGRTWQSSNYDTASARTNLDVSANVSSITLNPAGGCQ